MTRAGFILLGTTALVAPAICAAQPASPSQSSGAQLEELIVTAQKREQNVQDVPLAVTVLSGARIEQQRLFSVNDISRQTPNFTIAGITPSQPVLTIRGVGSTDTEAGSDRTVVPFVNEIYIGRSSAATFDIFDVERVEVLRGPQGTLFGRNVSGGAVSITNAQPADTYEGRVQITAGNYQRAEIRGMLNVPLSDTLAARFTVSGADRDGYYTNVNLGKDGVEGRTSLDGRAQLKWDNHGDKTLLLSASEWRDRTNGLATKVVRNQVTQQVFNTSLLSFFNTAAFPLYQPAPGDFNVENGLLGYSRSEGALVMARYDQDLSFGTLTIIPSWLHNRLDEERDAGAIPVLQAGPRSAGFFAAQNQFESYDAYSAEVRISSPPTSTNLNWVAGVYALTEQTDRTYDLPRQVNNSLSHPAFVQKGRTDSIAGFGQISWKFAPTWELTLGLRYTSDEKQLANTLENRLSAAEIAQITAQYGRAPGLAPALAVYSGANKAKFDAWTPKAALSWQPVEDQNFYASYTRGFKDGGFTGTAPNLAAFRVGFLPETVDSYEVGYKSMFFDRRVRVNIAAFQYSYRNLQLTDRTLLVPGDLTTAVSIVVNAGRATSKGIELEGEWQVTRNFTLGVQGDILDTRVTRVLAGSSLVVDKDLPRAPHSQYGFSGSYKLRSENTGMPVDLELGADYKRTGSYYFGLNENPVTKQSSFDLINARLMISKPDAPWSLQVWGRNLADKHYFAGLNNSGSVAFASFADPRTYGVTLERRW